MTKRLAPVIIAALCGALLLGVAQAVGAVAIYGNGMNSVAKRAEVRKATGRNCDRGGSDEALRVELGRRTRECVYQVPVVGRDLEIIATERLLSGTPRAQRRRMFLAVNLRSGAGRYQLAVFPLQRKYQLRKYVPGVGIRYLAIGKNISRIRGINRANELRLRAFNMKNTRDRDDCRLAIFINGKRMAVITDEQSGPLEGRSTTVSFGSKKPAPGAKASFDDVIVRVPDPF
jgi:hypothetical protein